MDFLHPDRVVVGADEPGAWAERVAALYAPWAAELIRTDVASAEMIKLASNAFLATKISFINEIANVCEEVGADVDEVARGMGLDPRIGPSFLRPGIGYGGCCFPKDVAALKQLAGNTGYHFQLLTAVIEVNELQKRRVVGKLKQPPRLAARPADRALGLAFKPDTDDMREASSIVLAARLIGEGAEVAGYDPVAHRAGRGAPAARIQLADSALAALEGADAVVIVTEWPEFAAPFADGTLLPVVRTALVIDGRNPSSTQPPCAPPASPTKASGVANSHPAAPVESARGRTIVMQASRSPDDLEPARDDERLRALWVAGADA